jgi:hypothetical protein
VCDLAFLSLCTVAYDVDMLTRPCAHYSQGMLEHWAAALGLGDDCSTRLCSVLERAYSPTAEPWFVVTASWLLLDMGKGCTDDVGFKSLGGEFEECVSHRARTLRTSDKSSTVAPVVGVVIYTVLCPPPPVLLSQRNSLLRYRSRQKHALNQNTTLTTNNKKHRYKQLALDIRPGFRNAHMNSVYAASSKLAAAASADGGVDDDGFLQQSRLSADASLMFSQTQDQLDFGGDATMFTVPSQVR